VQTEIDAARLPQVGDPPRPAREAAAGGRRGEQERRGANRRAGDDLTHKVGERHLVLGAGLGVLRSHHDAVGEEVAGALDLGKFAAAQAGEQR